MKKITSQSIFLLFATLFVAGSLISSCKKDTKTTTVAVNRTVLRDSIASADTLLAYSTEGVADGDYQIGSKATLKVTVDAVSVIANDSASTQVAINNAVVNLNQAVIA